MKKSSASFRVGFASAWIAIVSLPGWISLPAAHADDPCASGQGWPPNWGQPVYAECDAHPSFTIEKVDTDWHVLASNNAGGVLNNIVEFEELVSYAVPAQWNIDESWVDNSEPDPLDHYNVSATITNKIAAMRGLDAQANPTYFWGVYTEGEMVHRSPRGRVSREIEIFRPLGQAASSSASIAAALEASAWIAQVGGTTSGCFSQCMSQQHAIYYPTLADCLDGCMIGVGIGADLCVLGCFFSGPGYLACVMECLALDGALGALCAGGCVLIYTTQMAGAAIGCRLGCWGI